MFGKKQNKKIQSVQVSSINEKNEDNKNIDTKIPEINNSSIVSTKLSDRKIKTNMDKIDTLITNNINIEGTVYAKGTIRFDCNIIGNLEIDGDVIVGNSGTINGNINSLNAIVSGKINGNISCEERIHITNNGELLGDILAKRVIIDEDAIFEGSCIMKR